MYRRLESNLHLSIIFDNTTIIIANDDNSDIHDDHDDDDDSYHFHETNHILVNWGFGQFGALGRGHGLF